MARERFPRDLQYAKFSAYGFLKNLRFFEPFMVLFLLEKGISYLEVGTLFAVREIAINVLEIPTGAIADALGRRRTMIASFVSYLGSFVIFWLGSTLPVFLLAMLFFSFGEAFRTGTHKAMILTHLRLRDQEQFKTDYYGHTRAWSQMGSAVSALIAAAIVVSSGRYTTVFLFSTIPYALDLLLMLSYPKELDGRRVAFRWSLVGASFRKLFRSLRETLRRRGALRVVTSSAAFGGFYKGTKDYLQPMVAALALSIPLATHLPDTQREAILIGVVYTVLYLLSAWSSRAAGSIAGRLPSPHSAMNWELAVGLLFGIGIGLTSWAGYAAVPVLLFFSVYLIQNMRRPLGVSVVSDVVPEEVLATVLSVESQLQSLFAAAGAFAVGAVAQAMSNRVGAGIVVVSVAGLLALPLLWIRPEQDHEPADAPGNRPPER